MGGGGEGESRGDGRQGWWRRMGGPKGGEGEATGRGLGTIRMRRCGRSLSRRLQCPATSQHWLELCDGAQAVLRAIKGGQSSRCLGTQVLRRLHGILKHCHAADVTTQGEPEGSTSSRASGTAGVLSAIRRAGLATDHSFTLCASTQTPDKRFRLFCLPISCLLSIQPPPSLVNYV